MGCDDKIQGKCRAFEDTTSTFDFPVTALIGPNGGGKIRFWELVRFYIEVFNQGSFSQEIVSWIKT